MNKELKEIITELETLNKFMPNAKIEKEVIGLWAVEIFKKGITATQIYSVRGEIVMNEQFLNLANIVKYVETNDKIDFKAIFENVRYLNQTLGFNYNSEEIKKKLEKRYGSYLTSKIMLFANDFKNVETDKISFLENKFISTLKDYEVEIKREQLATQNKKQLENQVKIGELAK